MMRWVFGNITSSLRLGEIAVSAFAIGVLCCGQMVLALTILGLPGYLMVAIITLVWAGVEMLRGVLLLLQGRVRLAISRHSLLRNAWAFVLLLPIVLLFVVLFWLAGLEGLLEFDAVQGWAFKAKIMTACQGSEWIRWIQNKNLHHAHFDYPQLVPSLHALTYGAVGGVNEFVTKFWPTWMLAALCVGILSACGFPDRHVLIPAAMVTAVCFMPMVLRYVRMEGGTIPMVFFCCWGSIQISLFLRDRNFVRFGVGCLSLAGASMSKFEGILFLGLWLASVASIQGVAWLFREKRLCRLYIVLLAVMAPYFVYRCLSPFAHIESKWWRFALQAPLEKLTIFPKVFLFYISRRFVDTGFADWKVLQDGRIIWSGSWGGAMSLVDMTTYGIAWIAVLLTIVVVVCRRDLRKASVVVLLSCLAMIMLVSFVTSCMPWVRDDLSHALGGSKAFTGGRYCLPFVLAWPISLAALLCSNSEQ